MSDTTSVLSPGLPLTDSTTPTTNDVRRWVYSWFTMFEHRAPAERLVRHLAQDSLSLTFPGGEPLRSRAEFAEWYDGLLANTKWNFHELTNLTVVAGEDDGRPSFEVGVDIGWQGEVVEGSQWSTNLPDGRFRFEVHQDWHVTCLEEDALEDPFTLLTLFATMI